MSSALQIPQPDKHSMQAFSKTINPKEHYVHSVPDRHYKQLSPHSEQIPSSEKYPI